MGELLEGDSMGGDSSSKKEEMKMLPLAAERDGLKSPERDGVKSPEIRRSMRKTSLRSLTSRGRLAKSSPKSPLMRMAEMRKGGLRGRALHHSGKKGFDGTEVKASKGKKGPRGKNLEMVLPISVVRAESPADVEVEGGSGNIHCEEVVVMLEDRMEEDSKGMIVVDSGPKQIWLKELIPEGIPNDFALDLVTAQPLQEINFVVKQVVSAGAEEGLGRNDVVEIGGNGSAKNPILGEAGLDEDFPPLSKESLRATGRRSKTGA